MYLDVLQCYKFQLQRKDEMFIFEEGFFELNEFILYSTMSGRRTRDAVKKVMIYYSYNCILFDLKIYMLQF